MCVTQYLVAVLIYMSLVISNVEHLFTCLLAKYPFSYRKIQVHQIMTKEPHFHCRALYAGSHSAITLGNKQGCVLLATNSYYPEEKIFILCHKGT